ncbi:MAG: NUDIX domain-containing protein [Candidatus Pacebacteria bacterium]|nr:NUDIX domain-containing protein [Candidatus Paceibacterota bacterium]
MKILKDNDIFKNPEHTEPNSYEDRQTVKIIIKNDKGEIALITNPIHNFFLLPGGGAESNNLEKEAEREALEETHCYTKIIKEVGKIEEFRNRNAKHYITTCSLAEVIKKSDEDLRTEEEKKNGLIVQWFEYDEALRILQKQTKQVNNGEVKFYNTAFNIIRDYYFLTLLK